MTRSDLIARTSCALLHVTRVGPTWHDPCNVHLGVNSVFTVVKLLTEFPREITCLYPVNEGASIGGQYTARGYTDILLCSTNVIGDIVHIIYISDAPTINVFVMHGAVKLWNSIDYTINEVYINFLNTYNALFVLLFTCLFVGSSRVCCVNTAPPQTVSPGFGGLVVESLITSLVRKNGLNCQLNPCSGASRSLTLFLLSPRSLTLLVNFDPEVNTSLNISTDGGISDYNYCFQKYETIL